MGGKAIDGEMLYSTLVFVYNNFCSVGPCGPHRREQKKKQCLDQEQYYQICFIFTHLKIRSYYYFFLSLFFSNDVRSLSKQRL